MLSPSGEEKLIGHSESEKPDTTGFSRVELQFLAMAQVREL